MPTSTDKPPFGGHEPPPPPPAMVLAGVAFALALVTFVLLLLDRYGIATIFSGLTFLAAGATFVVLMRASKSSDKPGGGTHEPPPRTAR